MNSKTMILTWVSLSTDGVRRISILTECSDRVGDSGGRDTFDRASIVVQVYE